MVINRLITNSHVVAASLFASINPAMKKNQIWRVWKMVNLWKWIIAEGQSNFPTYVWKFGGCIIACLVSNFAKGGIRVEPAKLKWITSKWMKSNQSMTNF